MPWILIHGLMDNSGTFEGLAPLFPSSEHSLIAVDLPGNGTSSHLPPGTWSHYMDGIQSIYRLASALDLSKFGILGHSMGATMAIAYASMFPEQVQLRICELDCPLNVSY